MKLSKVVIISAVLIYNCCFCEEVKVDNVQFKECEDHGFTCENNKGGKDITFQCQEKLSTIDLWKFLGSQQVNKLTIRDCADLQINFSCDAQGSSIESLHVEDVANLKIIPSEQYQIPHSVIFQDVIMEAIPTGTFAKNSGCSKGSSDLDSIILRNAVIGSVDTKAFDGLTGLKLLQWENTVVQNISKEAVRISCQNNCSVNFLNNVVKQIDDMAFQVEADHFIISKSVINSLAPHAVHGNFKNFEFSDNTVSNIDTETFSLSAEQVNILRNQFDRVYHGTFEKIQPGAFGSDQNAKYSYIFQGNSITYTMPENLQPNSAAYKSISANVTVADNEIECTCENLSDKYCRTELRTPLEKCNAN